MGKKTKEITDALKAFVEKQHVFFVATATAEGRINLSPKGMDSLRILDSNRVVWLNLTGSGNETAAHLLENDRMTILFCSFEGKPLTLRFYGQAKCYHVNDPEFDSLIGLFPPTPGSRQIIDMHVDLTQSSCGFATPIMEFKEDRSLLTNWSNNKGEQGIKDYWREKNAISLDGKETGIV